MLKCKTHPLARFLLVWILVGLTMEGRASTTVTPVYSGITRHSTSEVLNGRTVKYEVMVVNLLDPTVSLVLTPGNGAATGETTRQTTRNFATQYGTEVAINTNYFESLLDNGADNMGFAAAAGEVLSLFQRNQPGHTTAINFSSDNFAEVVEGTDNMGTLTSTDSLPYNAIQPFPRLYLSGVPSTEGSDLFRARTQIGLSRDGAQMILFASTSQMTDRECADILRQRFGAYHVMGLDGGGSTTMVLRTGATTQTVIALESLFGERAVGANLGVQAGAFVDGIPEAMEWDADPLVAGTQQGGGIWGHSGSNWISSGTNRSWYSPRDAVLGSGNGALISLAERVGVRHLTTEGGYTIGTTGGPKFVVLGNLTINGNAPLTINAPLGEHTTMTKMGEAPLILGASSRATLLNIQQGSVDLSGQTLTLIDLTQPMTLQGGTSVTNGSLRFTAPGAAVEVPSGLAVLGGNLSSPGLTKLGDGTLRIDGGTTFGGPVSVAAGVLDLSAADSTATTLSLGGASGTTATLRTGSRVLTLGGNVNFLATDNPGGAVVEGRIQLGNGRIFTIGDSSAAADDLTIHGAIEGNFGLTKSGPGRLVLAAANSFGTLTLTEGTVRTDAAGALPGGNVAIRNGVLDLNGFDATVGTITLGNTSGFSEIRTATGELNMAGNLTYNAASNGTGSVIRGRVNLGSTTRSFTINDSSNATVDLLVDAAMRGTNGLTKAGAGHMEISGSLEITGTLLVNNGNLDFTGGNSSVGALTAGGTAGASPVLDTKSSILSIGGTLTYNAANNGLGAILRGSVDTGAVSRSFVVNDSSNATEDLRIEAVLRGSGGWNKSGAGTLTLAGSGLFTGPVTCSAGTLRIAHVEAFATATSLAVNGGATLLVTDLPAATFALNRTGFTLSGAGHVDGNVALQNGRILAAGPAPLTIAGGLNLTGGIVEIRPGASGGAIQAGGSVQLGGRLKVDLPAPLTGEQTLLLISGSAVQGAFGALDLPHPPSGWVYAVEVSATEIRLRVTAGTPAQSWLARQALPIGASLSDDFDGDGFPMLLEYALGGSARTLDLQLSSQSLPADRLRFSFWWNTRASDTNAEVLASSDLSQWTTILSKSGAGPWTGAAPVVIGSAQGDLEPVQVEDPLPGPRRFLRLRINQAD